jgi:hypothetical protein
VLMAVGYFQWVTRGELPKNLCNEGSRDTIGNLRGAGYIGSGPRSPTPGAPYTFVNASSLVLDDAGAVQNWEISTHPIFRKPWASIGTSGARTTPIFGTMPI